MLGIVIVAHGGLAAEYRAAAEHVVGPQEGIATVAIFPEDDRASKRAEISGAASGVDRGDGVIVVVDMFGGSPSNLSLPACAREDRRIVYGANLPMLIKLMKSRHLSAPRAAQLALEAGRKYIDSRAISPQTQDAAE